MPVIPSPADGAHFDEQGFVILRRAFAPERVRELRQAVERLLDRALAGQVEVPWIDRQGRVPARLSHLLHPDKYDPAYGAWLDEDLAPQLEVLLGGAPARHSLFGMLAGGGGQPYLQAWHRDLGRPGAPDELELLRRFHGRSIQFNAPLLPGDRFLNIVPATHLSPSTPDQLQAAAAREQARMPGGVEVELEPGDIAYYNANLWHRGWNPRGQMRWTLHCAFWKASYPVMKHEHGQRDALLFPGHLERLPPVTRSYIQRYLDNYPEGDPVSALDLEI